MIVEELRKRYPIELHLTSRGCRPWRHELFDTAGVFKTELSQAFCRHCDLLDALCKDTT